MASSKSKINNLMYGLMVIILSFVVFGSSGCLGKRYVLTLTPEIASSSNDFFIAELIPINRRGIKAFTLTIENKSDQDLEVVWNETLYIDKGNTSGGFMFEGVVFKDRNAPKTPDIVFAKSKFSKSIWPNKLVSFTSGKYGGWKHNYLPLGENGIYLTVQVGEKKIKEKITIVMTKEEIQK